MGAQVTGLVPVHTPAWQVSVVVQPFPSPHADPFAFGGSEQTPVTVSHTPGSWHWPDAVQTTGLPPVQTPAWQTSVCVQAFPSSHAAVLFVYMQPVAESHVSVVHTLPSLQTAAAPA